MFISTTAVCDKYIYIFLQPLKATTTVSDQRHEKNNIPHGKETRDEGATISGGGNTPGG